MEISCKIKKPILHVPQFSDYEMPVFENLFTKSAKKDFLKRA